MSSIHSFNLFSNECSACGKSIPTPATNRRGDVPKVFCNRTCETIYSQEQRMVDTKVFVPFKKGLTTDQVSERMKSVNWKPNHGSQYILENQVSREEIPV